MSSKDRNGSYVRTSGEFLSMTRGKNDAFEKYWRELVASGSDNLPISLPKGWLGVAEFHVWVMLDSGEVIDPVVFHALAENFKRFSCGAGKLNILCPEGRPYKTTHGLPQFQYHPLAVMP